MAFLLVGSSCGKKGERERKREKKRERKGDEGDDEALTVGLAHLH